jgi:hypothetical protein
VFVTG